MISIIGAGPVGGYTAYLLAKSGEKVRLYEEHKLIGKPVQCTGITTATISDILDIDENIVVNKVGVSRIYSPNNDFVDVKMSKHDYIFDRAKLDKYLVDLALSEGVEIVYGKRFNGYNEDKDKIMMSFNGDMIETDYLIGADGVNSNVAKSMGNENRKFLYGTQARVMIDIDDESVFETYLGVGDFAWVVPEDNKVARIGIIGNKESASNFLDFVEGRGGKIVEYQGGLVPLYNPRMRIQKNKVMLIGDAATQVKPTTYGGIVPGMLAARELVKDIDNYEKNANANVGIELRTGLKIRKILDKFSNEDYDHLVKLCKQKRVLNVLNHGNRDYPRRLLLKLVINEPRFLKYTFSLFK